MKSKRRTWTWLATAAVLSFLWPAAFGQTSVQGKSAKLLATAYGHFEYGVGWVGEMYLTLGDSPAGKANFVARNTGSNPARQNGSIHGTETWTVEFQDLSGTFEMQVSYEGIPGLTPRLFNLIEIGSITNGTGKYYGVTGHVTVRGLFLLPGKKFFPEPLFIGEVQGIVFGLD